MTSKRTAWLQMPRQLRNDPELGKKIQEIAAANFRSVQGQILMWIYEGVNSEKVIKSGAAPLEMPLVREPRNITPDQQRTYRIWNGMKHRCKNPENPAHRRYAGRGITVCDRWQKSFNDFLADMGPCPVGMSIDRINNDGNYEPGNCRWATRLQQNRNRSNTVNGKKWHVVSKKERAS